ncbi:hypothetical protein [Salibacterium halotolerans]|uniref:Uncharacterized protein n=1 Tax=Salibacterium halotolerans TaxID=1884432 RepID=A0A1I5W2I5_9BACI|nr:hypothetical protein [Salibacterium halotolerans]SFQ13900.1 hypothetical protein SAMN05518683_11846 [Salibacterium halotolerans]
MNINGEKQSKKLEIVLWSIALPGFGHLILKQYVKGLLLVFLETLVNVCGHFNTVIVLSFNGKIQQAIEQTDYQWLMFYPCLYFFGIWDAYREAGGGEKPFSYLPMAFSAYFVTVGLIFSPVFTFFGQKIGPMWLPMLFLPLGFGIGSLIRTILMSSRQKDNEQKERGGRSGG